MGGLLVTVSLNVNGLEKPPQGSKAVMLIMKEAETVGEVPRKVLLEL